MICFEIPDARAQPAGLDTGTNIYTVRNGDNYNIARGASQYTYFE